MLFDEHLMAERICILDLTNKFLVLILKKVTFKFKLKLNQNLIKNYNTNFLNEGLSKWKFKSVVSTQFIH